MELVHFILNTALPHCSVGHPLPTAACHTENSYILSSLCVLVQVQEKKVHPRQLRAVLRVAQCISLCAALVMLAYAGVSLHYLFRINFAPTVFAVFGTMK